MLLIEQALKERKRTFYCGCGKFQVNFSSPPSLARSKRVHHVDIIIIMIIKRRRATDDDSCCCCCFLWLAYRYLFLQALAPCPCVRVFCRVPNYVAVPLRLGSVCDVSREWPLTADTATFDLAPGFCLPIKREKRQRPQLEWLGRWFRL